jgi:hypothetical protein
VVAIASGPLSHFPATLRREDCVAVSKTNRPIDAGVAGASAEREYQRLVQARQRSTEGRFGRRLGRLVLAFTDVPQSTRAWAKGAAGEREVARALAGVEGIRLLNDLHVRGQRRNIDHIAVSPAGVFVIDAKDYRGEIRIRDVGGFFRTDERLFVGRRDCSQLADGMAWQVDLVERVVASCGTATLPPVVPVLCFVNGDWPLFGAPSRFRGVRLEGTNSIKKLLMREPVFDPAAIDAVARSLSSALGARQS